MHCVNRVSPRAQNCEHDDSERSDSSPMLHNLSESDVETLLQRKVEEIVSSGNPDERSLLLNVIERMRAVVLERADPVWEVSEASGL